MAPPLYDPAEVKGFRDVRPDVYYPLSVYCRLLNCGLKTGYRHAKAGAVKTLQVRAVRSKPSVAKCGRKGAGPRHQVLGAEILRVAGVNLLALPEASETKAERRDRVKGAVERLKALGVNIPEREPCSS